MTIVYLGSNLMDEQKRARVSVINEDILSDKNLTPAEKMVYARICYFEEFFEDAQNTAEYLGIKEWTVQSAKRKLEKLGYIQCIQNTGRGKRYIADVNSGVNKVRPCLEQTQTLVKTNSDVGKNKLRPWENQDIGKNISKNLEKKESIDIDKAPMGEVLRKFFDLEKDEEVVESVLAWMEMRRKKKWVLSERALERNLTKAFRLAEGNKEKVAQLFDLAEDKNWKGVFESEELGWKKKQMVSQEIYQPKIGEDLTYQRMFDKWKQYLGISLKQSPEQVVACKDLLDDIGEEWVEKLIVALRMRSQTKYVVREIKAIQDFKGLADNRTMVMSFYDEHWQEWKRLQEEQQTGKKPWEII